ncbi:uncharacterized protein STEHIDRAFT_113039 [Stereum hirsutum FP-91666 SS1]|uniref:uncharacterized protein n=1 Tax=Stereum hirsutum (strain FP-91666) TaxID=721885 RepID=UPI000444A8B0|nr:uncharacterized protein STEHIDRAFT_113039 [Stereum hirsutum FP-91666 SS1]EIM83768.1 hypothetical protein STEHIDRAFT_113039 [Stereum hirsutum FP-91666 SS1]
MPACQPLCCGGKVTDKAQLCNLSMSAVTVIPNADFIDKSDASSSSTYKAYCAERAPMEQLHPALTVDHKAMRKAWYRGPVKVAFGFGTTIDDLIAYAKRVELLTNEKLDACKNRQYRAIYINRGMFAVERHLTWVTRVRLNFFTPAHVKYDTIVTLWDNYAKEDRELDDQDTKEVLDLLRKELCLPEEEQPLWYFITDFD